MVIEMQKKDPKPEIMRLEELALLVKSGEIKLPKFQRPFVWQKPDMLKLLDSIYKGYPIGSILIWNSSQQLTSERSISGLNVNVDDTGLYPTNYLLDGQQRLTTLCGALFWDGSAENSIWNISFDLEREEFTHSPDPNLVTLFPLNKLIKTSDFIQQCMKFSHHQNGKLFFDIAERLLKSVKDYKIAVVKIGDMTIDEVAPIFERINSTGRKLTIVDLMMAATWSDGFDLASEIENIKSGCASEGFESLSDPIILRSISAAADLGINKDDIQRLRSRKPRELKDATEAAGKALRKAVAFLRDELWVWDYSYLPYGLQLTHLAEFLRLRSDPDEREKRELRRWFWQTSATRYFGRANTGQNSKDLALMRAFARGETGALFSRNEIDMSQLLYDRFNLRNATSTTFTLLLNSSRPKTTIDGKPLDTAHLLEKSNRYFRSLAPTGFGLEKMNLSKVIYPYSDVGDIGVPNDLTSIEQHLMDADVLDALKSNDGYRYAAARASVIQRQLSELTDCAVRFDAFGTVGFNDEASEIENSALDS